MKLIKKILFWFSTIILVIGILAVGAHQFLGLEFRTVLTGSMEPELPVGSLIVVVPTKAEDIEVGDDISFTTEGGRMVTHRVYSIDREKDEYLTRGIANDLTAVDPPNKYENILGVVQLCIPYLGILFSWLGTVSGKIIAITLIIASYFMTVIIDAINHKKEET